MGESKQQIQEILDCVKMQMMCLHLGLRYSVEASDSGLAKVYVYNGVALLFSLNSELRPWATTRLSTKIVILHQCQQ